VEIVVSDWSGGNFNRHSRAQQVWTWTNFGPSSTTTPYYLILPQFKRMTR
jgi:hypothetical protein